MVLYLLEGIRIGWRREIAANPVIPPHLLRLYYLLINSSCYSTEDHVKTDQSQNNSDLKPTVKTKLKRVTGTNDLW